MFQIPLIQIQSSPGTKIGPTPQIALPPGSVLSVTVAERHGTTGILLNGTYVEARLPTGITSGQTLEVEVLDAADSLLLKILAEEKSDASNPLADILLTKDLSDVVKNSRSFSSPPGLPLDLATPFREVFEKVIQDDRTLNETNLSKPEVLKEVLMKQLEHGLEKSPVTGRLIQELLAKFNPELSKTERTEDALREALTNVLQLIERTGGESKSESAHFDPLLQSPLLGSSDTDSGLEHVKIKNALPGELLKTLFKSIDDAVEKNDSLMAELQHELKELRNDQASDPQLLRPLLKKALQHTEQRLSRIRSEAMMTFRPEEKTILDSFEHILAGQDALNQMAPVLQAVGQPALLFIPAFLNGFLSRWELNVMPPGVNPDEDKSGRGRTSNGYERLHLFASFVGLGDVGIDLAHKPSDILLKITFDNPAVAAFAVAKMPELQSALERISQGEATITVEHGKPERKAPQWYVELADYRTVA